MWWKKGWGRLGGALGWLLESYHPLAAINRLVPRDGYREHLGISYGPLERQKLDVYVPKAAGRDLPVVVFFYGGSWKSGRRQDYLFVAEALTARGIIAVVPDYRVYPEVKFPTFVEDGTSAVLWVRNNISEFGGDPAQLFLMGHSAGAYIAAMLALDAHYLEQTGMSVRDLRGFIGIAGPYDFLPIKSSKLIDIFGGADGIPETQPVNFVSANAPPALLLHGAKDKTVRPHNTERLDERFREVQRPVEQKIYPGYRHIMILFVLATLFQDGEKVMDDIVQFITTKG